jgi:hypothetical protein
MKRVTIKTGFVGLVWKNGFYQRVITEGQHWLRFKETVEQHSMAEKFTPTVEIKVLLKDEQLARMLTVVDVKDNEIVVRFQDGNFKEVLTAGRHVYWKWLSDNTFERFNMGTIELPGGDIRNILNKPEILPFIQVQVVESYQKGLMFVDGKFEKEMESGIYFFWKGLTPITILKADLRQQLMEVSGQEILTKDKASIRLNVQTVYKITDVRQVLIENKDAEKQLYTLVQLALREEVGKMTIDELLAAKESLSVKMLEIVVERAKKLGITVLDCGLRDIILPGEIREIMNQVLVAQKKAEANMITRREETASTRSMLNTAKLMEDNAMLWRIKEMEFIEKVTEKINTISLGSGGSIVKQLKEIFTTAR